MASLSEIRAKYPDYQYLSDVELADVLHKKFYPDVPREEFDRRLGVGKPADFLQEIPLSNVPGQALRNLPRSAVEFGKALAQPILHPIDTATGLYNVGKGVVSKAAGALGVEQDPAQKAQDEAAADAVGEFLKDRYGGYENIKRTLATDPIGAFADLSTVLSLGGTAAARAPGVIGRAGNAVRRVGDAIDPVRAATAPVPVVARGAVNTFNAGRNALSRIPQEIDGMSRRAANSLSEGLAMSGATAAQLAQRADELGPRGMLADYSPSLTDIAEGLNQQPGEARNMLSTAYRSRAEAAPEAVRGIFDRYMGPSANVPETIAATSDYYNALAGPLYDQFRAMDIPQTQEIGDIIGLVRRGQPGLLRKAEQDAILEGVEPQYLAALRPDPMSPMTGTQRRVQERIWTGTELDYLKRAIDKEAVAAENLGNTADALRYQELARRLRTAVDRAIEPTNPNQSVYARAREISGQGLGINAAVDEGRRAFRRDLSADQLAVDQAARTGAERAGYNIGAREAARSTMDNAATNFGPRGDAAGRRLINSDENLRKMGVLIGDQQAQDMRRAIEAENDMAENYNQVMAGSQTARRQAIRDLVPRQYDATNMRDLRGSSVSGFAAEGLGRIANLVSAGMLNARNARVARDMAQALVARGADAQTIADGLMEIANRKNMSRQSADRIAAIASDLKRTAGATSYQVGRAAEQALQGMGVLTEDDQQNRRMAAEPFVLIGSSP